MVGERFEDRIYDRLAALGEVTSRPLFEAPIRFVMPRETDCKAWAERAMLRD
jgi:hypothetical protein